MGFKSWESRGRGIGYRNECKDVNKDGGSASKPPTLLFYNVFDAQWAVDSGSSSHLLSFFFVLHFTFRCNITVKLPGFPCPN